MKQKDVSIVPKAKGIIVGLTHLIGSLQSVNAKGNIPKHIGKINDFQRVEKYGFPDIIYPGTCRNDFFVTLEAGEFAIDKTIEVEAVVKMRNGEILPVSKNQIHLKKTKTKTTIKKKDCIRAGISESMTSSFKSTILYHTGNPRWHECISILIPPAIYEQCHLYFTVRTCSSSSGKLKEQLTFSYNF